MKYTAKNKQQQLLPLITGASIVLLSFAEIPQAQSQSAPANSNNSSTYQVQGKKGPNKTCHFSTSLTLTPGQTAVEERQVGFDPATCTLKMQRSANLTPDVIPNTKAGIASKSGTLDAPLAAASLVGPTAAVFRARAYGRTYIVNRNGVFQNQVKDGVDYAYNGYQVAGSCPLYGDQTKWNTSWWVRLSQTRTTCLYNYSKSTITSSTGARFGSPAGYYCGARTEVYYNRHKTVGKANGAIVQSTNWGGSYGCLSQLFIKNQIVRY